MEWHKLEADLERMLGVLENLSQGGELGTPQDSQTRVGQQLVVPTLAIGAQITPEGGKSKDAHDFLTLCHEMLETGQFVCDKAERVCQIVRAAKEGDSF
ncbi:hypothetical protein KY284_026657 [Solanum tuberosum]|nr:hypothetical protein KY284_026657 [Solanum tuberosum]